MAEREPPPTGGLHLSTGVCGSVDFDMVGHAVTLRLSADSGESVIVDLPPELAFEIGEQLAEAGLSLISQRGRTH